MQAQAYVTPESMAALNAAALRFRIETGKSADESLIYAGIKVASSGRSAARIGKAKRQIVENVRYAQAKWARAKRRKGQQLSAEDQGNLDKLADLTPFLIVRMRQGKKPALIPAYKKDDPRRVIENRGLSKKIWNIMVGKIGWMNQGANSTGGKHYRVSKYTEKLGETADNHVVRLVNKLSYQEQAYPGITERAVRSGTAALIGAMERKIKAATEKANAA
jgi:hypothetical protein